MLSEEIPVKKQSKAKRRFINSLKNLKVRELNLDDQTNYLAQNRIELRRAVHH